MATIVTLMTKMAIEESSNTKTCYLLKLPGGE
jgi:hypothetical protein